MIPDADFESDVMSDRREFEMTEADIVRLYEACKPVPYLIVGGRGPRSPQENANDAWCSLGRKMGFDGMTVEPLPSKGDRFFTAVPVEVESETGPEVESAAAQAWGDGP